jgi:hypothetical protein
MTLARPQFERRSVAAEVRHAPHRDLAAAALERRPRGSTPLGSHRRLVTAGEQRGDSNGEVRVPEALIRAA